MRGLDQAEIDDLVTSASRSAQKVPVDRVVKILDATNVPPEAAGLGLLFKNHPEARARTRKLLIGLPEDKAAALLDWVSKATAAKLAALADLAAVQTVRRGPYGVRDAHNHETDKPLPGSAPIETDLAIDLLSRGTDIDARLDVVPKIKALASKAFAEVMAKYPSRRGRSKAKGPCQSIAIDLVTLEMSEPRYNNQAGDEPEDLVPIISDRLEGAELTGYEGSRGAGSHSEIYATNDLLKKRPDAKPEDILVWSIELDIPKYLGQYKYACPHCDHLLHRDLLPGVRYLYVKPVPVEAAKPN